jgi:hypothetical protein
MKEAATVSPTLQDPDRGLARLAARHRAIFLALLPACLLGLALGGTLILYGEAIRLPLFFDDMVHLRWLDWHSLPAVWSTAEGLGYYRPLTMSVWKVWALLQGRYNPPVFHFLNLLLHALNTVLVGCIAWQAYRDARGAGRLPYALLAALIFLTFPFSYQAISSSSSLSKPLIATLTLGSALLYWQARRRRSWWLLGLSLLAGVVAPFAYESGVMVPLAILAIEVLGYSRREFTRLSWWPALYMLLIWGGALPLIVLMEPDTGTSLGLPGLLTLWHNGVFFVQGLLFPITPLATPLARLLPVDPYVLVAALSLLGLAALFAFYRWAGQTRLFLYALSWFVVGVLPLWAMLGFSYVITSPRLHYLGAVGSAMLWAGVPVLLWASLPARWWPKVLAAACVVAMLGLNVAYVRHKMALANTAAAPLWQAALAGGHAVVEGSATPGERLLYLNVPAWIAPKQPTYLIGTEGLTFIPDYARVQDFVYVNTGVEARIRAFVFDPAKQDWSDYIGYTGNELGWEKLTKEIRWADAVYRTTYSPAGLRFLAAGALDRSGHLAGDSPVLARFGDQFSLLDCQIEPSDGELVLDLWWYGQQVPDRGLTVFVHVYDENGQLVAQADGYPLLGLFPPQRWQPGDVVRDVRYIALPGRHAQQTVADGRYTIVVGWYDPVTGQRLPAFDRQGRPVANNAFQVCP